MEEMVLLDVPTDPDLLAAVGRCTLTHELLTYILRMTWMSVKGLQVEQALRDTKRMGSSRLREEIEAAAEKRFGGATEYSRLGELLKRCRHAAERRNNLIHSVCMKRLDGDPGRRTGDHHWAPLPTVAQLDDLAAELNGLMKELNYERRKGYLADVLARTAMT